MLDRLTQSHLLPPQEKAPLSQRIARAWNALPQVRAVRHTLGNALRTVESTLRWWRLRLSARFGAPLRRAKQRLAAWLKQTRPVRAADAWWRSFKKAAWELPQIRVAHRAAMFLRRFPLVLFILCMAALTALTWSWCVDHTDITHDEHTYLLVDGRDPHVYFGYPDEDYTCDYLYIHAGSNTHDAQIILHEGQLVTVRRGEETYTAFTNRETVANLLRRLEIEPTAQEMVAINVAGGAPIIHITEEMRFERTAETPTPYHTYSYPNYLLEKGVSNVVQEGKEGTITDTYEDVYRMGKLVSSHLVHRSDTSAVTEIVEYGRLVTEMEQDCKAVEDHPYRDGREGGYLIFECGDSMTYSKKVINNATAYYTGPITATGHPVGVGVIAVDPKVYPYHTSMYIGSIEGRSYYGIGTAYDCGGAVKNNIIDLWFPTIADCYVWGRRNVTCYILDARDVT